MLELQLKGNERADGLSERRFDLSRTKQSVRGC